MLFDEQEIYSQVLNVRSWKKNNIQNLLRERKMQLKTCIHGTLFYMGAIWKVDNT